MERKAKGHEQGNKVEGSDVEGWMGQVGQPAFPELVALRLDQGVFLALDNRLVAQRFKGLLEGLYHKGDDCNSESVGRQSSHEPEKHNLKY
jgi:hypothetical protein